MAIFSLETFLSVLAALILAVILARFVVHPSLDMLEEKLEG